MKKKIELIETCGLDWPFYRIRTRFNIFQKSPELVFRKILKPSKKDQNDAQSLEHGQKE